MWKFIPGYETIYEASSAGDVRNCATKRVLKPWLHRKKSDCGIRYSIVELWKGGTFKRYLVHRLILETFVGPRPSGKQCRHLNGDSLDNRLENLTWGTQEENEDDRYQHNPDWFLSAGDVAYIRAHPELSSRALAAELDCSKSSVTNVRNGIHPWHRAVYG